MEKLDEDSRLEAWDKWQRQVAALPIEVQRDYWQRLVERQVTAYWDSASGRGPRNLLQVRLEDALLGRPLIFTPGANKP